MVLAALAVIYLAASVSLARGGWDEHGDDQYRLPSRLPAEGGRFRSDEPFPAQEQPFRTESAGSESHKPLPWLAPLPVQKADLWFKPAPVTVMDGPAGEPSEPHKPMAPEIVRSTPNVAPQVAETHIEMEAHCSDRFEAPRAPLHATDLNGVALPSVCIRSSGPHHIYTIGDWGGIDVPPMPADRRSAMFKQYHREFVVGADDVAQQNVAAQMAMRALANPPDYVINVGDNFYWGGVNINCGLPPFHSQDLTGQWEGIFEEIYKGQGIENKQWLGILGNHDYGGYLFTNGWDQAIAYTWATDFPSTGRWMTPAQYWRARVRYPDFSVDYFFLDNNVVDTNVSSSHNICSREHNRRTASCGPQGPVSLEDCSKWFERLWSEEEKWVRSGLSSSSTDWQIVVIHFPPDHQADFWKEVSRQYGIDLIISGHNHHQLIRYLEPENFLRPTAYIVTGGGGGITSEGKPDADGLDDEYGFMDLTLSKSEITIEAISHGGQLRNTQHVKPLRPSSTPLADTPRYL